MRTSPSLFLRFSGLLGAASLTVWAADESVATPAKRVEVVTAAKTFLGAKEAEADIKNPFLLDTFNQVLAENSGRSSTADATKKEAPGPTSGRRTDRDILVAIAANLKPSGFFVLGDEPTLVFGQKRVKAGGTVSIRFEDADYTLEIVSIERPNFTLRLNREEFTRPIK